MFRLRMFGMTACLFFFNDTATTEIYTLSLHDALPICPADEPNPIDTELPLATARRMLAELPTPEQPTDTGFYRSEEHTLNSSHQIISYAVFCLKKKKETH